MFGKQLHEIGGAGFKASFIGNHIIIEVHYSNGTDISFHRRYFQ